MESGTLGNKDFSTFASENSVNITGHSGTDHGTVERIDPKTKEKSVRCKKFATIACEDHEAVYRDASTSGKFDFKYLPQSYILSPDGEVLVDLPGAFPKKEGIEKIKEAAKKVGPGMTLAAWTRAKGALTEGESLLASGDLKKALERFQAAGKEKGTTKALAATVASKIEALEAQGIEAVEAAKAETDRDAAKKTLATLARDLKGTKAGDAASKALAELG